MTGHLQVEETIVEDVAPFIDVWGEIRRRRARHIWSCECGARFESENVLDVNRARAVHEITVSAAR